MTSLPEPLPQILPAPTRQPSVRGGEADSARSVESSRFSDRLRQQDGSSATAPTRERQRPETAATAKTTAPDEAPAPVVTDGEASGEAGDDVAAPPALIVPVLVLPELALPDLGDLDLTMPGFGVTEAATGEGSDEDPLLAALAKLLDLPQAAAQTVAFSEVAVETIDTTLAHPLTAVPAQTAATTGGAVDAEVGLALTLPLLGLPAAAATTTDDGQALPAATGIATGTATVPTLAGQTQTGTDRGDAAPPEAPLPAPVGGERAATAFTAVLAGADEATVTTPSTTAAATAVDTAAKTAAEPRSATPTANPMERAVAQQVSRALLREGADGLRLTLRLTPPELGTVRIEIIERGGILQAHIHAEDDAVRVALERQLPQLRQDLRSHDAPVRDVHLGDAWSGEFTRQDRNQAQGRGGGNRHRSGFSLDGVAPLARSATAAPTLGGTVAADAVDARA